MLNTVLLSNIIDALPKQFNFYQWNCVIIDIFQNINLHVGFFLINKHFLQDRIWSYGHLIFSSPRHYQLCYKISISDIRLNVTTMLFVGGINFIFYPNWTAIRPPPTAPLPYSTPFKSSSYRCFKTYQKLLKLVNQPLFHH